MRKHTAHALLFVGGAVAVIGYFVYDYWPDIVAPLDSNKEKAYIVLLTFVLRRIQRPLWSILIVLGIIRFIGYATYGYYRRLCLRPIRVGWWWLYALWWQQRLFGRSVGATVAFALISTLFYFATFWLGTMAWAWILIEKLYFWIGDQLLDRGLYYLRIEYWIERVIHETPWLRTVLRPVRRVLAALKRAAETKRNEARKRAREIRDEEALLRAERERW